LLPTALLNAVKTGSYEMSSISKYKHALMATTLLALPASALAQNQAVTDQANKVAEQANELADQANQLTTTVADDTQAARDDAGRDTTRNTDDDDDGDEGKWGLLGLLGLAGLLGLKRRDRDHVEYRGSTTSNRTSSGPGTRTDTDTRL
jgi:MYXO-CTERM domain-containing protein